MTSDRRRGGEHEVTSERERGAGSILVVGLAAAILLLVLAIVPLGSVLATRQRAAAAADAAALAAADTAAGLVPGSPCASADEVAAANSARVTACVVEGSTATVRVTTTLGVLSVDATATAGQPAG